MTSVIAVAYGRAESVYRFGFGRYRFSCCRCSNASRGWSIHPVHCSQEPITGPETGTKRLLLYGIFWKLKARLRYSSPKFISRVNRDSSCSTTVTFTEKWCHTEYFIHMKRLYCGLGDLVGTQKALRICDR